MADLTPVRGQHGKYEVKPSTAELDAEICRLRTDGLSYRDIGTRLGIAPGRAHLGVKRGMASVLKEPGEAALALELNRLDKLHQGYQDQYDKYSEQVRQFSDDMAKVRAGEEVIGVVSPDHDRALKALAGLLRVGESRRKLLGMDQPAKVHVQSQVEYTINGVDPKALT